MILALALLIAGGAGWLFRYAYLPPFIYQGGATVDNPSGRVVVVCKADRWTHYVQCDSVAVDSEKVTREMQEWLRKREEWLKNLKK